MESRGIPNSQVSVKLPGVACCVTASVTDACYREAKGALMIPYLQGWHSVQSHRRNKPGAQETAHLAAAVTEVEKLFALRPGAPKPFLKLQARFGPHHGGRRRRFRLGFVRPSRPCAHTPNTCAIQRIAPLARQELGQRLQGGGTGTPQHGRQGPDAMECEVRLAYGGVGSSLRCLDSSRAPGSHRAGHSDCTVSGGDGSRTQGSGFKVAELARGFAAQAQRIDSLVSENATLKRRLSASGREWKKVRKAAGMSGAVVKSADEWVTTTTVRISERRVRELVLEISRKIGNATNGELTDAAKVNLVEALFEHPTFRPVFEAVSAPTSTAKVDRVKGALVRLKAHLGVHEGVAYEALLIAFSPSDSESVNSFANRPGVRLHHLYEHLLHF